MKTESTLRRGLAVATVVSALAAPTASAAPVEQFTPSTTSGPSPESIKYGGFNPLTGRPDSAPAAEAPAVDGDASAKVDYSKNAAGGDYAPPVSSTPAPPAPVRVVQVGADNGFDWGDAGIGAGGLLALVAIASGALVAIRHRPAPRRTVA